MTEGICLRICDSEPPPTAAGISGFSQAAELFLDLTEKRARQGAENANEPGVVDRAALIDHDLALFPVSGDAAGKRHAQEVGPREPGRARKDPGRGVSRLVEQIRLDHEHGPDLSGFAAPA